MRIRINRIVDRGQPNTERVFLTVMAPCQLSHYAVFRSIYIESGQSIASGFGISFWFPNISATPGDQIVLYTGRGTQTSRREQNGTTSYFYYWNYPQTLFEHPDACAVLFEIETWATSVRGQ